MKGGPERMTTGTGLQPEDEIRCDVCGELHVVRAQSISPTRARPRARCSMSLLSEAAPRKVFRRHHRRPVESRARPVAHKERRRVMYPATFFGLFPPFPRDLRAFVAMSFEKRFDPRWEQVLQPAIRKYSSTANHWSRTAPIWPCQVTRYPPAFSTISVGVGSSWRT